ncbi:hypothetical protein ACFLT1_03125 [Bacteroidota bacterium]
MKRNILIPILFLFSLSINAQINKIEHFYISSPHSEDLYTIFTTEFNLPVVWDYQTFGAFSSGAVTFGNVVFEFVSNSSEQNSVYYGIALEPNQTASEVEPILDSFNISHGLTEKYPLLIDDGEINVGWTNISLNHMLPDLVNLFLCDYHDREFIKYGREEAANHLRKIKGGILGIEYLKELVVGTEEPRRYLNELTKVPGTKNEDNVIIFSEGPDLKLIKSDIPFIGLLIKVRSIENAKNQLHILGIAIKVTDKGLILDDDIFSPQIELIE